MQRGPRGVFITGTDTGVGKTFVTTALVRALVRSGMRVSVMKPVAAGAELTRDGLRNADALALMAAANVESGYETVNPFCFPLPASPHIAAASAGIAVDRAVIRRRFEELAALSDIVVVEGAGGWLAPISDTETMADIAVMLDVTMLEVVGLRLGCLSHALLTAHGIESKGLQLAGWIANHLQPHFEHADENIAALEKRLPAPLLEVVPFPAFAAIAGAAGDSPSEASQPSLTAWAPPPPFELSAQAVARLKAALRP